MTPPPAPDGPAGGPRAKPQSILFACSENAVRSVMAENMAKRLVGRSVYIQSAGVRTPVAARACRNPRVRSVLTWNSMASSTRPT